MISRKELELLVGALFMEYDYDAWKTLNPKTAEDPEDALDLMDRMVGVIETHLEDYIEDLKFLEALRRAGVDNWDGYDFAHEMMDDDI